MSSDTAYLHHAGHGMTWALLFAFVGHGAFFAAVLFLGVLVSPFQRTTENIIVQLPHGQSLTVTPSQGTSAKPKGEERRYEVANAVAPTPAPRPAPTPAPTPEATPSEEKKIVIPDKTPTATPEPKKASVDKIVKATPPPEPAKPAPPAKTATKTPAATQKEVKAGTGTSLGKVFGDGPPPLPGVPTGPAAKGDPNGATQWGDPNAPINTSVVLPADYLADLLSSLRANFSVPNNLQGVCVVEFKIARDGTLRDIKVLTTSGYPGLDAIALRAVQTTARVRAYAEYTQVPEITATVPFHFGADSPAAAVN
jgi:protein TonB